MAVSSNAMKRGFSLIEVMVIVIIIGILVGISFGATSSYRAQARDSERVSDVAIISRNLERKYRTQAVSVGATYPASTTSASQLATFIDDTEATLAPGQTSNSIVIATTNAAQTPTFDQYIYQSLNVDESLCTTAPCFRYKLYYRLEDSNIVVIKDSLRQQ